MAEKDKSPAQLGEEFFASLDADTQLQLYCFMINALAEKLLEIKMRGPVVH